jgi:hypothetical protein
VSGLLIIVLFLLSVKLLSLGLCFPSLKTTLLKAILRFADRLVVKKRYGKIFDRVRLRSNLSELLVMIFQARIVNTLGG